VTLSQTLKKLGCQISISVVRCSGVLMKIERKFLAMTQNWKTVARRMAAPLHG
jgi:heat shock protein HslJ